MSRAGYLKAYKPMSTSFLVIQSSAVPLILEAGCMTRVAKGNRWVDNGKFQGSGLMTVVDWACYTFDGNMRDTS